ncbi:MAG: DUF7948 domain-containing protein [Pirellulales bacterium]
MLSGAPALEVFSALPAVFVGNQGQWADDSVRFAFNGSGANVAMTDHGPVFQLFQQDPGARASRPLEDLIAREPAAIQALQFSANFVGANAVVPTGEDQTETVFNYFVGDQADWRSSVPGYATVAYENLYAGIDLKTWGKRDGLKYEFHVAPGADYRQIQVSYERIDDLALAEDGSLRVHLGAGWGELIDDAPYIYQMVDGQQVAVAGQFELIDSRTYTFAVTGDYDRGRELVIDPDLAWASYLGGSGEDAGLGIAVDAEGNALVTGYTSSVNFPTPGGSDTNLNGTVDAFVAKVTSAGQLAWASYLGGRNDDEGHGIAVDAAGNALLTGSTRSTDFPTPGGFDTSLNGIRDAFVAKLTPAGQLEWSSYMRGTGDNDGSAIVVDTAGNALLMSRLFAAKVTSAGQLAWTYYLSDGHGIAADAAGNALFTGRGAGSNAFVTKVTSAGRLAWTCYMGGNSTSAGLALAVDAMGNAWVTGLTGATDFATPGAFDTTFNGEPNDAFVAKVTSAGKLAWASYLGGNSEDYGRAIAVDAAGNVLVAGETYSSNLPTPRGFDRTFNGSRDAFVVKVTAAGQWGWGSYLGGSAGDAGLGIAVDRVGNAFVTGATISTDFPTPGGFDTSYHGSGDAFVAKIRGAGDVCGDVDKDGDVDILDVAVLQTKYGIASGATWADGDFNHNGMVDIFDVALMQVNYGLGVVSPPAPAPLAAAPSAELPLGAARARTLPEQIQPVAESFGGRVSGPTARTASSTRPIAADGTSASWATVDRRHTRRNGTHAASRPMQPVAVRHAVENARWESSVDQALESDGKAWEWSA